MRREICWSLEQILKVRTICISSTYSISFLEQKFSEVGSILTRNSSDESNLSIIFTHVSVIVCFCEFKRPDSVLQRYGHIKKDIPSSPEWLYIIRHFFSFRCCHTRMSRQPACKSSIQFLTNKCYRQRLQSVDRHNMMCHTSFRVNFRTSRPSKLLDGR